MVVAVYSKSLVEDRTPESIDVVSLVATDCNKLHEATATLNYLWSAIVEALAIIGVLLGIVGVSALPGMSCRPHAMLMCLSLLVRRVQDSASFSS